MIRKITLFFFLLISFTIFGQSNFSVEVNKINYENYTPPTPDGLFTISYTPGPQGAYLSVGAENSSNSMFDIIVSNLYLPSISEANFDPMNGPVEFSTTFDFTAISLPPYSLPVSLILYIHILTSPGFYPFDPSTWADTKVVNVTEIIDDTKGSIVPPEQNITISSVTKPGHTVGDPRSDYRHRTDAPNLDLNDSENGDTDTYAGDKNACVPTATANSIKWMEQTYTDINLPEDMTLRKTMETLSGLMKRERNEGTTTENMISGKLDFMEQYNLPVEVKFQAFYVNGNVGSTSGNSIGRNFNEKANNVNKPPTWEFLKKMMKDGEDVEINYTWKSTTDNQWYAHSVNLTGINEFESGVKKIAYKHDRRQGAAGGLKEDIHQVTVDADGWMRFGEHNEKFIRDVVVESPIIQEGRETAAWLNELFANSGPNKVSNSQLDTEYIEIALNSAVTDLAQYTITLYNGTTGESYATYTLNQFTVGNTANGLTTYYMNFSNNEIVNPSGIAISYTGTVIQNQFLSFGGSFTAVDGDATGLTSTNIGEIATGYSFQLSGSGDRYSQFGWIYGNGSPGLVNTDQTYSATPLSAPSVQSPADTQRNLSGTIDFNWGAVTGATHYHLQLSTEPYFVTGNILDENNISTNSFTTVIAEKGIKVYWRVRAENNDGVSAYSGTRYFTTRLDAPTNLSVALNQSDKPELTWIDNSSNESGFKVERKTGSVSSGGSYSLIGTVTASSYTDETATTNNTYTYRVYSYNDNAESEYSDPAEVEITAAPPDMPTIVSPTDGTRNLSGNTNLVWHSVSGATKYRLQISTDTDFTSGIILDQQNITDTAFTFAITQMGVKLYWRVRAENDNTQSSYSTTTYFTTRLATPTNLVVILDQSNMPELTWIDNSNNENGFKVERKNGVINSTNPYSEIANVTTANYSDPTALPNSTYTYRVYAYNNDAESGYSAAAQISIPTSVEDEAIPTKYVLYQNHPNPFNPTTVIRFAIPEASHVKLEVLNLLGETIAELKNEYLSPGYYETHFNANNLPSGIYIYRLVTDKYRAIKKMMFVK